MEKLLIFIGILIISVSIVAIFSLANIASRMSRLEEYWEQNEGTNKKM